MMIKCSEWRGENLQLLARFPDAMKMMTDVNRDVNTRKPSKGLEKSLLLSLTLFLPEPSFVDIRTVQPVSKNSPVSHDDERRIGAGVSCADGNFREFYGINLPCQVI